MTSRVLFASEAITIGAFRAHPRDAQFGDSGPTRNHVLVFPRTPVIIQHADREAIVTDPTLVMIYNRGQAYARRAIAPIGDHCEWFAYSAEAILEARGDRDGDHDRPFGRLMCAPSSACTYALAQLAIASRDPLLVEEIAATLLDAVIARPIAEPIQLDVVDATRTLLARSFTEHRALAAIARQVGVSMFHLARMFRRATGRTIHRYRTELRVRAAAERLADCDDLAALAIELGFSSHSHLTATFRSHVGVAPSQAKRDPRALLRARI